MMYRNPESILRDECKAADDAFTAVAMREGVTRQEVEEARRVRVAAADAAHGRYRHRFKD